MSNVRLRTSMAQARVDLERVSEKLQVDPKTVQRWLKGRIPHARHRWALAALVDEDEHYLWPPEDRGEPGASVDAELVAAYIHRADVQPGHWWELMSAARSQLDFLGYAMLFLLEQHPGLATLFKERTASGCKVRVALVDPHSREAVDRDREERLDGGLVARIKTARRYLRMVDDCPGVKLHYHRTPMYNSVFRFDDHMFVTPHLYGVHGYGAPLLHLRRKGGGGLFDSFARHFEDIWASSIPANDPDPEASPDGQD